MVKENRLFFLNQVFLLIALSGGSASVGDAAERSCKQAFVQSEVSLDVAFRRIKFGEKIPKSLLKSYSSVAIAEKIVERIRLEELRLGEKLAGESVQVENFFSKSDLILFFPSSRISSILSSGNFLNLHQTGSTRGNFNKELRMEVEDFLAGFQLGQSPESLSLRPKYAFLNVRSNVKLPPVGDLERVFRYGDVGAVLKSKVKARATWTIHDSLYLGYHKRQSLTNEETALLHKGTFFRTSFPTLDLGGHYYEAQILGETIVEDAEYFLVRSERSLDEELKAFGKPIYLLATKRIKGRTTIKKGKLLFNPPSHSAEVPSH